MDTLTLSKLDVAERQLRTACRLYFHWGDEVSVHALATAARNVLCDICAKSGVTHPLLREQILDDLVEKKFHKEVRDKFRQAENFFKHADRDHNATFSFCPSVTEYFLIEAVEAFARLSDTYVAEFHLYRGWWLLHHQESLTAASGEFLKKLNGVSYREQDREHFFADMMASLDTIGLDSYHFHLDMPKEDIR